MTDAPKAGRSSLLKPMLLLGLVAALMFLGRMFHLGDRVDDLRTWIHGFGAWGPLVFAVIYIGAVVLALPGSLLTVTAGALFGSVQGVIVVSIASTAGAGLAFLIARRFARASVESRLKDNRQFQKLASLTEKHGAIVVAITRLVPIFPFNLLNYGFGLTRVPFSTYLLWSWLCMLPGTILYVVGTDAVARAVQEGRIPWLLVGVVLTTVGIITILVRQARRRMRSGEETVDG